MKYQDLIESVRDRVQLDDSEHARQAVEAVLATLGHCMTPDARTQLAEHLPGLLEPAMEVPGDTEIRDSEALLIEIAYRIDSTPERARYIGEALLETLREMDPDLVDELRGELHTDLLETLEPEDEPPEWAGSVDPSAPSSCPTTRSSKPYNGCRSGTVTTTPSNARSSCHGTATSP